MTRKPELEVVLERARLRLREAGLEFAGREAAALWEVVSGQPRQRVLAGTAPDPSPEERSAFDRLIERRLAGEPLAYLCGWEEFWGLRLAVDARVLIPRLDSETVVTAALRRWPVGLGGRVVDLGTGSGCLLLAFLEERPLARGLGIDRSAAALRVARMNAARLGLTSRSRFLNASWLQSCAPNSIDLVLANPPYVVPGEELGSGVAEFEPASALFTPVEDPLRAYREIFAQLARVLRPQGHIVVEVGWERAEAVTALAAEHGMECVDLCRDEGGIDRALVFSSR